MDGHYRWCSWCCNLRYPLCCDCNMCSDCCKCPPPSLPQFCSPSPLPDLPCMGQPPPPVRIIRERVLVPYPYPVYPPSPGSCLPACWEAPMDSYDTSYRERPRTPLFRTQGQYDSCRPSTPRNYANPRGASNGYFSWECDPCNKPRRPRTPKCCQPSPRSCDPCQRPCGDGRSGCIVEKVHPCPWPSACRKRIHQRGQSIIPGYKGHVPGMRFHAAGRSYGQATRDTCCIMSQWGECCPQLPCRIFEQ